MRDGTLNSALVAAGLLSLGMLVAGCGKAPPATHPKDAKTETAEKQVADLIRSAEGRDGQGPWVEQAQFELGERYYRGEGVPKDMAKAAEWWQEAAEQGNVSAQYSLGSMYHRGSFVGEHFVRDDAEAVLWWQKAAAQGHAGAQYDLGSMYRHGQWGSRDDVKAAEWYQKAADQGHAPAQYSLGFMYYRGEGVSRDAVKAVEWYRKAALQGDAGAQYNLGLMYYRGEGVSEDNVLADAWFDLSAKSGVRMAVEHRGDVEHRMSAAEIAEAQRLSSSWRPGQNLVR
jgi:TPR repeat protein